MKHRQAKRQCMPLLGSCNTYELCVCVCVLSCVRTWPQQLLLLRSQLIAHAEHDTQHDYKPHLPTLSGIIFCSLSSFLVASQGFLLVCLYVLCLAHCLLVCLYVLCLAHCLFCSSVILCAVCVVLCRHVVRWLYSVLRRTWSTRGG